MTRYEAKGQDDGHTFLFVVSRRVVIDAGVDGNDARFINHSCEPNCDTVIEDERVFIEPCATSSRARNSATSTGSPGRAPTIRTSSELRLPLRARRCRGTMLAEDPLDKARRGKRKAEEGAKKTRTKAKTRAEEEDQGQGRKGKGGRQGGRQRRSREEPSQVTAGLDHRRDRRPRRHRPARRAALAPAEGPEALQGADDGQADRHGPAHVRFDRPRVARAHNIVVSRQPGLSIDGCIVVPSLDAALEAAGDGR